MKTFLAYCLLGLLAACSDVFDNEWEMSDIRWDECEQDFTIECRFMNGEWVFNASSTVAPLYYAYWTMDGALCEEYMNTVKNIHLDLGSDHNVEVCMIYMNSDGCHKACATIDPTVCDNREFYQLQT